MTENWTREKIEEAYKNGRRDFSGKNFSGLDLREITLSEADLSEAALSEADLSEADMAWTNLSGADISGADLRRAELAWTNLSGAVLRRADLTGADLTRADLSGANIDFSAWPLRCGSLNVRVDKTIAVQLMYHACALDCDDPEYREARAKVLDFANQMHRPDVKRLE